MESASRSKRRIHELTLLAEAECEQLLNQWNATAEPFPVGERIPDLFRAQAERTPDAIALRCQERSVSYKELELRSNRLANRLLAEGCTAAHPVGVLMDRGVDLIVTVLAIWKAGLAYVPLDPAHPDGRLAYMLEHAGTVFVAVSPGHVDRVLAGGCKAIGVEDGADARWSDARPDAVGNDLAYVMYTSGSTGRPKGVAGLHSSTLNRFRWMWRTYPFATGEVACQKTSINFVDSVWEVWGPLLCGVPLLVITDEVLSNLKTFLDTMQRFAVSRLLLVPSLLRAILGAELPVADLLASLRMCISSGEMLDARLADQCTKVLPHVTLLNLYGSTEVSGDVLFHAVRSPVDVTAPVSIGRPMSNTDVFVLDAYLELVPVGARGELYVGGHNLARGYFHDPGATALRYIPHPYSTAPGARLFRTGDLVRYRPDGEIEYLGRIDHQVKIRGMRVEPGEVEHALRGIEGIADAVVVVQKDVERVELVGYYVANLLKEVTEQDLRESLSKSLPRYMVPTYLVALERMPLLTNGKVDRHALPPPVRASLVHATQETPRDEVEARLVVLWQSLLELPDIGTGDDFFGLGGNSLDAMRMVAAVNAEWPAARLEVKDAFDARRIAQLAAIIRSRALQSNNEAEELALDEILQNLGSSDHGTANP